VPHRVDPLLADLILVIRVVNVQTSLFDPLAEHGVAGAQVGADAPVEGIVGVGNVVVTPEKESLPYRGQAWQGKTNHASCHVSRVMTLLHQLARSVPLPEQRVIRNNVPNIKPTVLGSISSVPEDHDKDAPKHAAGDCPRAPRHEGSRAGKI
jgi:hypothetical protein